MFVVKKSCVLVKKYLIRDMLRKCCVNSCTLEMMKISRRTYAVKWISTYPKKPRTCSRMKLTNIMLSNELNQWCKTPYGHLQPFLKSKILIIYKHPFTVEYCALSLNIINLFIFIFLINSLLLWFFLYFWNNFTLSKTFCYIWCLWEMGTFSPGANWTQGAGSRDPGEA